jgi:hypothetical protein
VFGSPAGPRSRSAIQWNSLTHGGAQLFQISFQDGEDLEPWKEVR